MKLILTLFFISSFAMAAQAMNINGVNFRADSIKKMSATNGYYLRGHAQASVHSLSLSCHSMIVLMRADHAKEILSISGVKDCTFKAGKKSVTDKKGFLMRQARNKKQKWIVTNSAGKSAIPSP
jgi:hypothetical protein